MAEWPRLKRDRVGLWIKTVFVIKNGAQVIPAGTECLIVRWYGGAELWSKPCSCCGVSVRITHVRSEIDMEVLDKPKAVTFKDSHGDICINWQELTMQ